MKTLILAAFAFASGLSMSSGADAATFLYRLLDHPDRAISSEDYGLRLDRETPDAFFSFENGASSILTFDDVADTASMSGTMRSSTGELWTLEYVLTGVTDIGGGLFYADGGSGTLTESGGPGSETLIGKTRTSNGITYAFALVAPGNDPTSDVRGGVLTGTGWLEGSGTNDFLFTATPVPLPAALPMMLGGVFGLYVLARRRKRAA